MTDVVVCSIFRNSAPYLDRYFGQINRLRDELDLRLSLAEGDSTDLTETLLPAYLRAGDQLLTVNHGGPHFGSVDNEQRWEQIAQVVRPTIAAAGAMKPKVLVWVESDLMWEPEVMIKMIDHVQHDAYRNSVAPMVLAAGEDRFYDTWGFRMGGRRFTPGMPYLPASGDPRAGLVKIDSCGSCFVTTNLTAAQRWDGHWPYPGHGGLWLDTTICVEHP